MEYVSIIRFYNNESQFHVRVHGTMQYTINYISGYLQGLHDDTFNKDKSKFNFTVLSSETVEIVHE